MHNPLAIHNNNNIPFFSTENIGISRDTDKKWINQYSTLFYVLNNIGQIVTWRLTLSVVFSSVESLVIAFCDRLAKQGMKVKELYVCRQLLFVEAEVAERVWSSALSYIILQQEIYTASAIIAAFHAGPDLYIV